MEIFVASIMLIAIGIMFRVIKFQAAFVAVALVCLAAALIPSAGKYANYVPSWVFWGVVIILGINLLRTVLGALFGRRTADYFTGGLLMAILRPVIALFEGLVRAVFRIR